jgi:MYXO-CTERM domain-containing protein
MATCSTSTRAESAPPWRWLLTLAAVAALVVSTPPGLAERVYARGLYPWIQAALTSGSNLAPIALFDVICAGLVLAVVAIWWSARRERRRRAVVGALVRTALVAVIALLWFQLAWGLNYARPPVDERLALPRGTPSEDDVAALLTRAVAAANHDHAAAHAVGFPGPRDVPPALVAALHKVERADGRPRATVVGRPKPTLLAIYFRMAGVDGLTAPAFLETLLNPDLTGPERPFVLAHEWAHLAGYAPEADANFVAWRAALVAGAAARYSAALFLLAEAARQVPRERRRAALATLAAGPREDLAAIERRAAAQVDLVQRVGWRVYDGYLRAQGVREGVASYSRVIELIVRAERRSSLEPSPR